MVCASTLDNNVAPSVESVSNIRGHSALLKKASPKIGDIAFCWKTASQNSGQLLMEKPSRIFGDIAPARLYCTADQSQHSVCFGVENVLLTLNHWKI